MNQVFKNLSNITYLKQLKLCQGSMSLVSKRVVGKLYCEWAERRGVMCFHIGQRMNCLVTLEHTVSRREIYDGVPCYQSVF